MRDLLSEIEAWFDAHCDGVWEHEFGVRVESLDNPGWIVHIDLGGTRLDRVEFMPVSVNRSDSDWIDCRLAQGQFRAAGGPRNLGEILRTFLDWAKEYSP